MTNETTNSRPTHRVFAVTKNGKKKFWQPIGALWAHADGKGFNQRLDYRPRWMAGFAHFEFRSPHEPPRPIPVSETGYRSYFAAMADVELWAGPQDFARDVALALLQSRRKLHDEDDEPDRNQLSLF